VGTSPIADMDAHQAIVSAALSAKTSAETARVRRRTEAAGAARRAQPLSYSSCRRHQMPVASRRATPSVIDPETGKVLTRLMPEGTEVSGLESDRRRTDGDLGIRRQQARGWR
jgi:hypothetical protein